MSIFDNAVTRDNERRVRDGIRPMETMLDVNATGRISEYTTDRNKEWVIRLRLEQNFWANDVQRRDVERTAMRALAATLYQDVLRELPRLRLCIESGDKAGAIESTLRIERATQP